MANLTFQQVENLWVQEGGSPEWAPTMAAVAIGGESGGDPTAKNPSGADGLFQILMSAQSPEFQKQWAGQNLNDPAVNTRVAVALLGNGSGISNWSADPIGASIVANGSKPLTPQQAQQYATNPPPAQATLMADTTTGSGVTAGPTKLTPPEPGVNIKDFHGYDLSAIPTEYLGEAEQAIQKFISDPALKAKVESGSANSEYGYSSFSLSIPQLNAIVITSALAPNGMWDENTLQGIISNTDWYKTTDQNERTYQAALVSDPSSAHNALVQAQDKVLATANQIGVQLTKSQLDQIAEMYAAQSYTPTNTLGAESGTSQEWLDQAVIDSALNVKGTGQVTGNGTSVNEDYSGGSADLSSSTSPTALGGISQQLYSAFQQVAQNYLLYDPNNPNSGLLTTSDIMRDVDQALLSYTGTGSSGLASEFVNNATAKFTQQAMAQASSVYPTLAPAIQQGTSPLSYVTPLTNYVASQLGMSSGQINVMDPQWNWLIATTDPKSGIKGPVTQDQALQKITSPNFSWTDPNGQKMTYMNTNSALQIANGLQQSITSAFGKGA